MTGKPIVCPDCGIGELAIVIDSRKEGNRVRRRRECSLCGERTITYEIRIMQDGTPDLESLDYRAFSREDMNRLKKLLKFLEMFMPEITETPARPKVKLLKSSSGKPKAVEPDSRQPARDKIRALRDEIKNGELNDGPDN